MKPCICLILVCILCSFVSRLEAQSTLTWSYFGMGYASSSGSQSSVTSLVGQPFVGVSQSANNLVSSGFFGATGQQSTTEDNETLPVVYQLEQNYPNPFNPSTMIQYYLPQESNVRLIIFDVLGQVVVKLTDRIEQTGNKSVEWNASNVASGIYFYRLQATSIADPSQRFTQVKKMFLLK